MGDLGDYIWLFIAVLWILIQLFRRGRRADQAKPAPPRPQAPRPQVSQRFSGPQIGGPRQIESGGKPPPPIVPR